MRKQVRTFFNFWGIWFVASLLNGVLSGTGIIIFSRGMFAEGTGTIGLSLVFSFLFSAPMVGVLWLVASIAISMGQRGDTLFQTILGTALVLGIAGAIFFILAFGSEFKDACYAVGACIIVSALAAPLCFRKPLKSDD